MRGILQTGRLWSLDARSARLLQALFTLALWSGERKSGIAGLHPSSLDCQPRPGGPARDPRFVRLWGRSRRGALRNLRCRSSTSQIGVRCSRHRRRDRHADTFPVRRRSAARPTRAILARAAGHLRHGDSLRRRGASRSPRPVADANRAAGLWRRGRRIGADRDGDVALSWSWSARLGDYSPLELARPSASRPAYPLGGRRFDAVPPPTGQPMIMERNPGRNVENTP
jgi:hypothetical protein